MACLSASSGLPGRTRAELISRSSRPAAAESTAWPMRPPAPKSAIRVGALAIHFLLEEMLHSSQPGMAPRRMPVAIRLQGLLQFLEQLLLFLAEVRRGLHFDAAQEVSLGTAAHRLHAL